MKIEKRTFRIGELAKALSQPGITIETSVIRFWEKEFHIPARRTPTGQRFYNENDFLFFSKIKELLYEKKFTIQGAKIALQNKSKTATSINNKSPQLQKQLQQLRAQLIKIKELF